ncbi:hypothetical protein Dhaf_0982 [Desulfitobacterium hafniense DCB-2]|uniref:Uncharacterized protein n=1 Tax=Desulfitobacterium hafniense (strain DSM 10664 / DCB-2) TaxID=272564 RepID=B8FYF5_DESHD|nr:hypothetical protein Dhaf_0982 [Desulfitobacterium hafniense DCB-2]
MPEIILIIYLAFFAFIIFFMISIINFMKRKTQNDELIIIKIEELIDKLPGKDS